MDLFTFHVSKDQIRIIDQTPVSKPLATEGKDFGFFDDAPGLPGRRGRPVVEAARTAPGTNGGRGRCRPQAGGRRPQGTRPTGGAQGSLESSTLRVSVSKVDQLINLVGELVITQAMLAQKSRELDSAPTSRCWPAWPTWTATPATCRKR